VLNGANDLIVEFFLFDGAVGVTGEQGPHVTYTSQFSAISMTQGKLLIYTGLNDGSGNLAADSPIQWTPQPTPSASVERYRLHVAALPVPAVNTIDARLVFQFWRKGIVDGKTKNQQLSKRCAEILSVVGNV
jgi:hypothetical protein